MTIQTQITLIKGDGTYPAPETRRILPTRALLWKYYLKTILIWLIVIAAHFLAIIFFSFVARFDSEFVFFTDPEFQLLVLTFTFVCSLVIIPVVLILHTFYIRNMQFIVH